MLKRTSNASICIIAKKLRLLQIGEVRIYNIALSVFIPLELGIYFIIAGAVYQAANTNR